MSVSDVTSIVAIIISILTPLIGWYITSKNKEKIKDLNDRIIIVNEKQANIETQNSSLLKEIIFLKQEQTNIFKNIYNLFEKYLISMQERKDNEASIESKIDVLLNKDKNDTDDKIHSIYSALKRLELKDKRMSKKGGG